MIRKRANKVSKYAQGRAKGISKLFKKFRNFKDKMFKV